MPIDPTRTCSTITEWVRKDAENKLYLADQYTPWDIRKHRRTFVSRPPVYYDTIWNDLTLLAPYYTTPPPQESYRIQITSVNYLGYAFEWDNSIFGNNANNEKTITFYQNNIPVSIILSTGATGGNDIFGPMSNYNLLGTMYYTTGTFINGLVPGTTYTIGVKYGSTEFKRPFTI